MMSNDFLYVLEFMRWDECFVLGLFHTYEGAEREIQKILPEMRKEYGKDVDEDNFLIDEAYIFD